MAVKFMDIDGNKLHKALDKRGLMITHVAAEIGRGSTYITDACKRNKLQLGAFKQLNLLYHITEEEILPDKKEEVVEPVEDSEASKDVDISKIEKKLDIIIKDLEKLISGMNDLGRCSVVSMEHLKCIKDELK